MPLKSAFEHIWQTVPFYVKGLPTERDYLRSIHHNPGLTTWAHGLNLELLGRGLAPVSVSSIWVDHTPQCWYGHSLRKWTKPSCELADLLVIVWDDQQHKAGKALLVQAKKGKNHDRISVSNPSTKKELRLLGKAPKFLLSAQPSVRSNGIPKPIHPTVNCEFQLSSYAGTRLRHCTFLQVKDARSTKWPFQELSWQTMWPPSAHQESYSEAVLKMVIGSTRALGQRFIYGNLRNDWDRLVTVLITETLAASGGTSKGSKQHTAFSFIGGGWNLMNNGENDITPSDEPQGIPLVFITPYPKG